MDLCGKNWPEDGVQNVLSYMMKMQGGKQGLFYATRRNNDEGEEAIFWADDACIMNYNNFGDTVVFDTSFKLNAYKIPFVSFTGLNHHGQPVLFGCGLLLKELYSSYVWLLKTWLQALKSAHPTSITTAPDSIIEAAISHVLPGTRSRYCKGEILGSIKEKLPSVCQSSPAFEMVLMRCINESETPDEFEVSWQSLMRQHSLVNNEWLHSLYSARAKWVPAYLGNTFFGEEAVKLNAYFDGFVSGSTAMENLMDGCEKAVSSWFEKEQNADIETISGDPCMKTSSPMEKQVADIYTRGIFYKFQNELVESMMSTATMMSSNSETATYRVVKYREETKPRTVIFHPRSMKANCSCQMFEFSGIICRHILAVFKARNLLTLPNHFILKRWIAKSTASFEAPESSKQSFAVRYNNIREMALKYAEDCAKSIEAYHIAMDAMKEISKKVEAAKKLADEGDDFEERVAYFVPTKGGKENRIHKLKEELESVNRRSEIYRASLMTVMKELEDQKLKLSVIVQNAKVPLEE